jgi:hypothetical protein
LIISFLTKTTVVNNWCQQQVLTNMQDFKNQPNNKKKGIANYGQFQPRLREAICVLRNALSTLLPEGAKVYHVPEVNIWS